jgi:5-(carboxyamino)imidazole ribonucleotide synthase
MILPGATLGVLGGGQLGRMFTLAARIMGYKVVVLDPDPMCPASAVADQHLSSSYTDPEALDYMVQHCTAVTIEFENVPVEALRRLETECLVRPGASTVGQVQDRIREKALLRECGLTTVPYRAVYHAGDLDAALASLKLPAILKLAALGYDGKGQRTISSIAEARQAFADFGSKPCVLEQRVDLHMELSLLLARSPTGEISFYTPAENIHVDGILDTSIVPARTTSEIIERATRMARTLAEHLDYCGLLAVEFFLTRQNELQINEIAPRPHNSGHFTLDACLTSQFEQQVRMLCGLPPGDTRLLSPAVMVNLLGDLWQAQDPDWGKVLGMPNVKLHLYGKHAARPGRKMGHYNVLAPDVAQAMDLAERIRQALRQGVQDPATSPAAAQGA